MSDLVVPLAAARRREVVGGKAERLGAMLRSGLAVPPGFVITTAAYRRHREGLRPLDTASDRRAAGDAASVDPRSLAARLVGAAMPAEVAAAVSTALAALGERPVAVRSSAVAEDLGEASFAGQHDTLLDVHGAAAVLAAVRRCWASLWSERACRYRDEQRLAAGARGGEAAGAEIAAAAPGTPQEPAIAVIVQAMVPAEQAGVLFTADPLTGERDRLIVEVVAGSGEALVAGRATADRLVLRRPDGRVVERHLASGAGSGLTPPLLAALLTAGEQLERLFQAPQDVEWAAQAGALWLLQSRPITHLPAAPVPLAEAERPLLGYLDRWREMAPGALTPLIGDIAIEVVLPAVQVALARHRLVPAAIGRHATGGSRLVRGRLYLDLDGLTRSFTPGLDPIAFADLAESGRRPPLRALRWSTVLPLLLRAPAMGWRLLQRLGRLEQMQREATATFDRLLGPYESGELSTLEPQRLVELLRLEPAAELRDPLLDAPPANPLARACAPISYTALGWMVARWAGEPPATAATLVAGLPGLVEVECAAALWELAERARREPAVQAALAGDAATAWQRLCAEPATAGWRAHFSTFLERFGHRAIEEIELARPRWREQPAYPLSVIANYLGADPDAAPRRGEQRRRAAREQAEARVMARLRRRPLRRALLRRVLAAARQTSLVGENSKADIMRLFWVWRCAALELGRRLTAAGQLAQAEDVFYLRLAELAAPRDFRAEVVARRAEHASWQSEDPPRVIDGHGRAVREGLRRPASGDDGALAAVGTSPGIARGRVRVICDPAAGARLDPGEVLVAPYTDPAWTPLFFTAAAVVVEVGSLLSHASIVAREAGIPSVVGLRGATQLLRDGQLVEVDGTRGVVRPLPG